MEVAPLRQVKQLYYITHINNVPSILQRGIFSHERVESEGISFTPIYDAGIVAKRRERKVPDGRNLWSFANLYFQPRNAMLYRVVFHTKSVDVNNIVILGVQFHILNRSDIYITTGNAASQDSLILAAPAWKKALSRIRRACDKKWWYPLDGSKRQLMAECLVPDFVPRDFIRTVYVANREIADRVRVVLSQLNLPDVPEVIPEPRMFIQPVQRNSLPPNLAIMDGDMFFSRMHTLTVSVNCVGVMGAGLASRAKYQFPDVYVRYQDACRKGKLKMGEPFLLKYEVSLDYDLADEPVSLSNANQATWFLLFPTKRHWRDRADIIGIEKGLQWLRDNYKKAGIKSLAIPALGCGLGRLDWRDVGPLMYKYLITLHIPVEIYLPAERKVPDELLSKDFLLGQRESTE